MIFRMSESACWLINPLFAFHYLIAFREQTQFGSATSKYGTTDFLSWFSKRQRLVVSTGDFPIDDFSHFSLLSHCPFSYPLSLLSWIAVFLSTANPLCTHSHLTHAVREQYGLLRCDQCLLLLCSSQLIPPHDIQANFISSHLFCHDDKEVLCGMFVCQDFKRLKGKGVIIIRLLTIRNHAVFPWLHSFPSFAFVEEEITDLIRFLSSFCKSYLMYM